MSSTVHAADRAWTVPTRGRSPFVLAIVAAVAVGFAAQMVMGVDDAVARFGVNSAQLENGDWYRLITASYLNMHGLWHVTANLTLIAAFGPFVEMAFGWMRTAIIWFVGSICAWLTMMALGTDASTGAGSSAGATALMGGGFVAAWATREERPSRIYALSAAATMTIIVVIDVDAVSVHAGGFAAGAGLAAVFRFFGR